MGIICGTSDSGSGVAEGTAFIQCINGQEPQIHELWCLGLEVISRKFYPMEHLDVTTGTVGSFLTEYLAKNGRIIEITGQLSINDSVQFLGFSDQA